MANVGTCPPPTSEVRAIAENMNDTVVATASLGVSFSLAIGGGDGNDTLVSSAPARPRSTATKATRFPATTSSREGPASETMIGGSGNDVMAAGPRKRPLFIQDGDDIMNGGPGDDLMTAGSTRRRSRPVAGGRATTGSTAQSPGRHVIDVDGAADDGAGCPGAGCEGDNVMPDVEDVSTGQGDDT